VLFIGAAGVEGSVDRLVVGLNQIIGDEIILNLFTRNVGQHHTVDFLVRRGMWFVRVAQGVRGDVAGQMEAQLWPQQARRARLARRKNELDVRTTARLELQLLSDRSTTMISFIPQQVGEFGFNCGMGMMTPGSKFTVVPNARG